MSERQYSSFSDIYSTSMPVNDTLRRQYDRRQQNYLNPSATSTDSKGRRLARGTKSNTRGKSTGKGKGRGKSAGKGSRTNPTTASQQRAQRGQWYNPNDPRTWIGDL